MTHKMPEVGFTKGLFEACRVVRGVGLHVCFCRGWFSEGPEVFLIEPFQRALYWAPMGPVECRISFPPDTKLPNGDIELSPVQCAGWMEIDLAVLAAQTEVLELYSKGLPAHGFRRKM